MSGLLALDVAILPPREMSDRALQLSVKLPDEEFKGLRLDDDHLPHITLTQQFVPAEMMADVLAKVAETLGGALPMHVQVIGGVTGGSTVWMAVERTPALVGLHQRLMEALRPFERPDGDATAFAGADARAADVAWVRDYRLQSSGGAFRPHITLGHASRPPHIEPFAFEATTVAACHLGRFCTCRRVLGRWELTLPVQSSKFKSQN